MGCGKVGWWGPNRFPVGSKISVPSSVKLLKLTIVGGEEVAEARVGMIEERKVFMVRHAQSEANVASARLGAGEVSAIWPFLTMGADAPLSDMGRQQLAAAQAQLVGFIEDRGVQLIAHSPLVRAQQTAHALFSDCGAPFVELPFVSAPGPGQMGGRAGGRTPCRALAALPFRLAA